MDKKEVHFTEKRVDESWKENISKDRVKAPTPQSDPQISFAAFVSSLGIQALIALGEIKTPGAEKTEVDLEAVRETIDLLLVLKEKTEGNRTPEEESLITSLIADLQLKFVQRKAP